MAALKIDFVSDIACPWCAVGLAALEQAIDKLKDEVQVTLHFQPFELNPTMPPEGQDIVEHLSQKYGMTAAQVAQIRNIFASAGPKSALPSIWTAASVPTILSTHTGCCIGPKLKARQTRNKG